MGGDGGDAGDRTRRAGASGGRRAATGVAPTGVAEGCTDAYGINDSAFRHSAASSWIARRRLGPRASTAPGIHGAWQPGLLPASIGGVPFAPARPLARTAAFLVLAASVAW